MRIRIGKVTYENFKGFGSQTVDFQNRDAVARAENGGGKTSLADGVFWVLYDKNAAGDKKFGIRPVDTDPDSEHFCEPIRGLIVKVVVELLVDGTVKVFRKEQKEIVKEADGERKYSYPNRYLIDGYAMLENKYKQAFEDIIPAEKFKMLTDLDFFNNDDKYKWPKRREVLRDMSGNIPQPQGHDGLIAKMKGHDVDDFKKTLIERKKLLTDEQRDNGVRLDEKHKDVDKYCGTHGDSEKELRTQRVVLIDKRAGLIAQSKALMDTEKDRQEKYKKINDLKEDRQHREGVVRNQSGPLEELHDERAKLEQYHADKTQELVNLQNEIRKSKSNIKSEKDQLERSLSALKLIRDEYQKAKAARDEPKTSIIDRAIEHTSTCSLASAVLHKDAMDFLADSETIKQGVLNDIKARGDRYKKNVDDLGKVLAELAHNLDELITKKEALVEELKTAEVAKNKRMAEIAETIETRPQTDPSGDAEWQKLTTQIETIQAELGEPVSEQLDAIEAEKGLADELLRQMDESLAKWDVNEDNKARIAELDARQKVVAQLIADVMADLDEVARYKLAQSQMVETAVNGMFKYVTWRLFEYYQNGEINDQVCVALLDGKPYPDLSKGEQVFANNDVINTLGDYFAAEVFRFVDHAESVTLPIEANSQVIKLRAVVGVKELEVEVEAGKAVA